MTEETLTIRPAQLGDLEEITDIHMLAFRPEDNFTARLGRSFARKSNEFFLTAPDAFGFVAVFERKVVGYVLGYVGGYTRQYNRYRLGTAVKSVLLHPTILFDWELIGRGMRELAAIGPRVFRKLFRRTPAGQAKPEAHVPLPEGPKSTVASIAVHPEYTNYACRSRGMEPLRISDRLLKTVEQFSRRRGMVAITAGVLVRNIPSRKAFERNGYRQVDLVEGGTCIIYGLPLRNGGST